MDPAILLTLRLSFALLLGAAAMHKLRDLARFEVVLAEYELLPRGFVRTAAPVMAATEASLAVLLSAGVALHAAGAATTALMLAYAFAIHTNVVRGRTDIDCGCMGPASRVALSPTLVVRNLVLAMAASLLLVPASARELGWPDVGSVLAATLALSGCWVAGTRLLALAPRAAELRSRTSRQRAETGTR